MADTAFIQKYRQAIRHEQILLLNQPQPIFAMLRYHMGWIDEQGKPDSAEGKMVRGILCLLASKAVGGDYRQALPAATAVEIVHNFSLIHDDIEDVSTLRRQRPTVWKIWGQPQAINAGDAMLILAHQALTKLTDRGLPAEKVLRSASILDDACLKLCLGQQVDLAFEKRLDVSIDSYLEMISHKTAALFEASLLLGASLGTNNERLMNGLGCFGRKLGLAFQLQDDEMGIWGDEKYTGKSTTSDIYEKKKSLPIVYALEQAIGEEKRDLERIYRQERLNSEDEARIRQILSGLAAREYTQGMAEKYFHEAQLELEAVNLPDENIKELKDIVSSLQVRQT